MSHVVVVGAGNAALVAAIAAREGGADVTVMERAPYALRGGNSRFTAGAMRTVYGGVDDLRRLMPELTAEEVERADYGCYSRERFYDDLGRVTEYRADPDLAERLVDSSLETLCWMRDKGVRFLPALRTAVVRGGWQGALLGRCDRRGLGRRTRAWWTR